MYDLEKDPLEEENLALSNPNLIKHMEDLLHNLKLSQQNTEKDFIRKQILKKRNRLIHD